MIFDTHTHTSFSSDSKMNIKDAINKAKALDIGLIITDHMDLNYPEKDKFKFNVDDYFKTYEAYKSPSLLLGIELGMDTGFEKENASLIKSYNFDQVIGSQHFLHGFDIYDSALYDAKTKEELFRDYFLEIIASLKTHSYIDTLGHIDFISRYCPFDDKEIYYRDYSDHIDEIIKLCISYGISMEINSRRLGNPTAFNPLIDIYRRYKELGGEYVTIGSDAHYAEYIGSNINKGLAIAETLGLRPIYFKDRRAEYMK